MYMKHVPRVCFICDAASFRGRAVAIIRSGYEKGNGTLRICADGLQEAPDKEIGDGHIQ